MNHMVSKERSSTVTAAWALCVAAIAAFATRRVVGRTRATADEARRALPGDDIITNPTNVAVEVN